MPCWSELKSEIGGEGVYAPWLDNSCKAWFWKSTERVVSEGCMLVGDLSFLFRWEMLKHL